MLHRRRFLQTLSSLPLVGGYLSRPSSAVAASVFRDFLQELGVPPIINAAGHYTMLTGSLMWPETLAAMVATSKQYVRLVDLSEAVGARIAGMLGCEDALVTSGAAGALTLGTAACITGTDPDRILRIPDLEGMKNEVIIQKSHRFPYDHSVRNCGIRMVEVETREDLVRAIGRQTVLLLFLNKYESRGQVRQEEFVRLGREHGVPTFIDAAADLPPAENLTRLLRIGFDLVTFSGGKALRGPQSAGLLLGRRDLIAAARLNTVPHSDTLGRNLKVNKEEMVGMMVALEMFLAHDHAADWKRWEASIERIRRAMAAIPGVRAKPFVHEVANASPHLWIEWDSSRLGKTPAEVARVLGSGHPPIELAERGDHLEVAAWTLEPGEDAIVARRLRDALTGKA